MVGRQVPSGDTWFLSRVPTLRSLLVTHRPTAGRKEGKSQLDSSGSFHTPLVIRYLSTHAGEHEVMWHRSRLHTEYLVVL